MAMPTDLFLIRHGQSEGNVAAAASRHGDESAFTDEFVTTPGRRWSLTSEGREQARSIGEWLKRLAPPARCFVSPYIRTRETAALLGLEDHDHQPVEWLLNRSLRERDWGDIETVPHRVFLEDPAYTLSARKKQIDPLYWRPPGGEAVADVAENRVRNFLDTLHRECDGQVMVAVTHGEFIRASRLVLERADDEDYVAWETDPNARIRNCEVWHYSRRVPDRCLRRGAEVAPDDVGAIRPRLAFRRRAWPVSTHGDGWAVEVTPWQAIEYRKLTAAALLAANPIDSETGERTDDDA